MGREGGARQRGSGGGGGRMADRASGRHENSCSNSTKRFTAEGGKTVVMDKSARADTYIIITGSTNRPARISV